MLQQGENGVDDIEADLYGTAEATEASRMPPESEDPRVSLRMAALRSLKSRAKKDKPSGSSFIFTPSELDEPIPGLPSTSQVFADAQIPDCSKKQGQEQAGIPEPHSPPSQRRRVYYDIDAPGDSGDVVGCKPRRQRQRVSYADEVRAPTARSTELAVPWLELPKQSQSVPVKRSSAEKSHRYPNPNRRFIGVHQSWDAMVIELSDDDDDDDDGDDEEDGNGGTGPSSCATVSRDVVCTSPAPALRQKEREIEAMLLRIQALEHSKKAQNATVLGKRRRTDGDVQDDTNVGEDIMMLILRRRRKTQAHHLLKQAYLAPFPMCAFSAHDRWLRGFAGESLQLLVSQTCEIKNRLL